MWDHSIYNECCLNKKIKEFYPKPYYQYRSFFWNVIYRFICDYNKIDRESWEWSKKLIWSNLYKIAPDKGNPHYNHCVWQNDLSLELVKKEIEEINPTYCIVITGKAWWEDFEEFLKPTKIIKKKSPSLSEIDYIGMYKKTKIIVTTRPQFGNSEIHVQQLLKLMASI